MPVVVQKSVDFPPPAAPAGSWLTKGFWAVLDQGLFAGSNFLLNVLLAKFLTERDYGAFATAFSVFLLLGTVHSALLVEPMLVFGPDRYRGRLPAYFDILTLGHAAVAMLASMLLLTGALICHWLGSGAIVVALLGLAGASPFILYQWLMRRASYVRSDPQRAAMGGAGYCLLMVGGLLLLEHWHALTIASALMVMGTSSCVVGIYLAWQEGVRRPWRPDKALARDAAAKHAHYGRWTIAGGLVGFVPAYVYYLILPLVADLQQSGALRAMTNLVMPLLQVNLALCILLLPRLVRCRGTAQFARTARNALLVLVGASAAYYLFIAVFHEPLRRLVYGDKFQEYSSLLLLIGLQPILTAATGVLDVVVASHERPDYVFYSCLAAAIAAVTVGAALTWKWGVAGVAMAVLINFSVHLVVIALLAAKLLRQPSTKAATEPIRAITELNAMNPQ